MAEAHVWNERLSLGDDELDSEHHLQIAMVGALAEAIEQARPTVARRLAEQLAAYSAAHFDGEQLLMETSEYPGATAHVGEHQTILNHVEEIRYLLGTGEYGLAHPMALDLLTGLGSHIGASDRAFAAHLDQRRKAAAAAPAAR